MAIILLKTRPKEQIQIESIELLLSCSDSTRKSFYIYKSPQALYWLNWTYEEADRTWHFTQYWHFTKTYLDSEGSFFYIPIISSRNNRNNLSIPFFFFFFVSTLRIFPRGPQHPFKADSRWDHYSLQFVATCLAISSTLSLGKCNKRTHKNLEWPNLFILNTENI